MFSLLLPLFPVEGFDGVFFTFFDGVFLLELVLFEEELFPVDFPLDVFAFEDELRREREELFFLLSLPNSAPASVPKIPFFFFAIVISSVSYRP